MNYITLVFCIPWRVLCPTWPLTSSTPPSCPFVNFIKLFSSSSTTQQQNKLERWSLQFFFAGGAIGLLQSLDGVTNPKY